MNSELAPFVIAVDGGGTRCRVAASRAGEVVSVETGTANVSTDFDSAVGQILLGLQALAARLGCSFELLEAAPAFVGLAGVTGPQIADRLRAALPFGRVRIEDDRIAALRGALGQREGVVAHCGTGSFFAARIAGEERFSGGWGSVLGDEASAHWVGRLGLSMTLETVDGRLDRSDLSVRLLAEFDGSAGIVRFAGSARPSDIGKIAPTVTELAVQGDPLAKKIMYLGANEIARAVRHLGWRSDLVLCLTGGIGPLYAPYLPDDLKQQIAHRDGEPLDGAIAIALDLAKENARERG